MLKKADHIIQFPEMYSRSEMREMRLKLEYLVEGLTKNTNELEKNFTMVKNLINKCKARITILSTFYEDNLTQINHPSSKPPKKLLEAN